MTPMDITTKARLDVRKPELLEDYHKVEYTQRLINGDIVYGIAGRDRRALIVHDFVGQQHQQYTPTSDELCYECHRAFSHGIHEKIASVEAEDLDFTIGLRAALPMSDQATEEYLRYRRDVGEDPTEGQPSDKDISEDWDRRDSVMLAGADKYSPVLRQPAAERTAPLPRQWWDAERPASYSGMARRWNRDEHASYRAPTQPAANRTVYAYGLLMVINTPEDITEWRTYCTRRENAIRKEVNSRYQQPRATEISDADYWLTRNDDFIDAMEERYRSIDAEWGTPDHPR